MSTLKYSRQRESIRENINHRSDHPTADMVYSDIRKQYPNISLGTVYRNLSLLADLGEVVRISNIDGADRFDGNTAHHHHVICRKCGDISDIHLHHTQNICADAQESYMGTIEDFSINYYGICETCMNSQTKE